MRFCEVSIKLSFLILKGWVTIGREQLMLASTLQAQIYKGKLPRMNYKNEDIFLWLVLTSPNNWYFSLLPLCKLASNDLIQAAS